MISTMYFYKHKDIFILTEAEKAMWNWEAKHAPDEKPLTETVSGLMRRLSRTEFGSWQKTAGTSVSSSVGVILNSIFKVN